MASTLLIILFVIAAMILATAKFKIHPFFALLTAGLAIGFGTGMAPTAVLAALQKGFGDLMGQIGVVVVLGSILGVALEQSGAALRLADAVLGLLGSNRPVLAMSVIGGLVGIPVFCDSGFIILSGLKKAVATRTGTAKGSLTLALASGLYATHTLVPPTPGPIAAAGNLGASMHLGLVMLLGLVVAIPTTGIAYWWALRRGPAMEIAAVDHPPIIEKNTVPLFKALLPLGLPIVLIALGSIVNILQWKSPIATALAFAGQPLIGLFIGTLLAFLLFPDSGQATWAEKGIKLAGPILIITGAGGALGGVLKATPFADGLKNALEGYPDSGGFFLVLAFIIAAFLKTMQGSSTSALVITTAMLAPLLPAAGFDSGLELALVVLATGAGAMTVSHANDSYFWVVTQFSGISVRDAYRSYTTMTGLQGLAAICTVLLLYFLCC